MLWQKHFVNNDLPAAIGMTGVVACFSNPETSCWLWLKD